MHIPNLPLRFDPIAWFSCVVLGYLATRSSKPKAADEPTYSLPNGHKPCNSYYCDYCS